MAARAKNLARRMMRDKLVNARLSPPRLDQSLVSASSGRVVENMVSVLQRVATRIPDRPLQVGWYAPAQHLAEPNFWPLLYAALGMPSMPGAEGIKTSADLSALPRIDSYFSRIELMARYQIRQGTIVPAQAGSAVAAAQDSGAATGKGSEAGLQLHRVTAPDDLLLSSMNILEPKLSTPVWTPDMGPIDVMFVPGTGFADAPQGSLPVLRLGRGGGFFDRWLSQFAPTDKTLRVGVSYDCQYSRTDHHHVPHTENDEALHTMITEEGIWPALDDSIGQPSG